MREPVLTERLLLRDCTEADAPLLFALDHHPEVMRAVGPPPADDLAWYRDRIRSVYVPYHAHPWRGVRLVFCRRSDRFLGWVFVRPATASRDAEAFGWNDPHDEEIGYRYLPEAWGRGVATEAARPLVQRALTAPETRAIVAAARIGNHRSLRVLEKLGLERTGTVTVADVEDPVVTLALAAGAPWLARRGT